MDSKIIYKENGEEKEQETSARIEQQFYKELYSYEDWQGIEEGTYQNYKLMNDIDFSERANIKSNVTMSRLESNGSTLKNIEINLKGDYAGLIRDIRTDLRGVNFENIIINANSGNYIGIIAKSTAKTENLNFSNITINASTSNTVGCIGIIKDTNISNITAEEITITGKSYIGGIVGSCTDVKKISEIVAKSVIIDASDGEYVGGLTSRISNNSSVELSNIIVQQSTISSKIMVGGIFGFMNANSNSEGYIILEDSTVSGDSQVGGIGGYLQNIVNNSSLANIWVKNSNIFATGHSVGGIAGYGGNIYNSHVIDSNIICNNINSNNVGGIIGSSYGNVRSGCSVENCKISSKGSRVGGLIGYLNNAWVRIKCR